MGIDWEAYVDGTLTDEDVENLEKWGYDLRHFGDCQSIQDFFEFADELGFDELADELLDELEEAASYYSSYYDDKIYYNAASRRWHDTETERFVENPYIFLRS